MQKIIMYLKFLYMLAWLHQSHCRERHKNMLKLSIRMNCKQRYYNKYYNKTPQQRCFLPKVLLLRYTLDFVSKTYAYKIIKWHKKRVLASKTKRIKAVPLG